MLHGMSGERRKAVLQAAALTLLLMVLSAAASGAWTINEALSAADVVGVDLDLEAAVETGKLLHLRGVVGSD